MLHRNSYMLSYAVFCNTVLLLGFLPLFGNKMVYANVLCCYTEITSTIPSFASWVRYILLSVVLIIVLLFAIYMYVIVQSNFVAVQSGLFLHPLLSALLFSHFLTAYWIIICHFSFYTLLYITTCNFLVLSLCHVIVYLFCFYATISNNVLILQLEYLPVGCRLTIFRLLCFSVVLFLIAPVFLYRNYYTTSLEKSVHWRRN